MIGIAFIIRVSNISSKRKLKFYLQKINKLDEALLFDETKVRCENF